MKKILAAPKIDFADSSFESLELKEDNYLYIYISSWKNTLITMKFQEPIHFSYRVGGHISDFYEICENSPMLEDAINRYYSNRPDKHSFKLFQIEDLEDFPFIQVVAINVEVECEGREAPETGKGTWYNPETGESLHPDLNHPPPKKPHWDYEGANGEKARLNTDGTWEWM